MEQAKDKTILVVDDEPNVRQYLRSVLEDAGFNVITAEDGEVALEMIRERHPDFISLDLLMPRKSGHKLLFELKRDREMSRIPVLIVTAHARDELGRDALNDLLESRMLSGPGTYLEKPVNRHTYVRSIQRALGVEESPEVDDKLTLKEELESKLQGASPEDLRKALDALKKRSEG